MDLLIDDAVKLEVLISYTDPVDVEPGMSKRE